MNAFFYRLISQLLVLSLMTLPFSTQAAMIGTGDVIGAAQAQANRDKVRDFVARADVQKQMEALGLGPATAKERVDALTDDEIQRLAGKIDSLPAGAHGDLGVVVVVLVVAIVILLLWK
jgi:RNase P/RNase MRP subunit p30